MQQNKLRFPQSPEKRRKCAHGPWPRSCTGHTPFGTRKQTPASSGPKSILAVVQVPATGFGRHGLYPCVSENQHLGTLPDSSGKLQSTPLVVLQTLLSVNFFLQVALLGSSASDERPSKNAGLALRCVEPCCCSMHDASLVAASNAARGMRIPINTKSSPEDRASFSSAHAQPRKIPSQMDRAMVTRILARKGSVTRNSKMAAAEGESVGC